jgi:hypothetical protein
MLTRTHSGICIMEFERLRDQLQPITQCHNVITSPPAEHGLAQGDCYPRFPPLDSHTIHAALTCPSPFCTKIEAGKISMEITRAQVGVDGHGSQ